MLVGGGGSFVLGAAASRSERGAGAGEQAAQHRPALDGAAIGPCRS